MVSTRATKYTYEAPVKPASSQQRTKPPSSKQRAPKRAAPAPEADAHPLHDAGILQRIIDYVGPGNFAYLGPVSMEWAIAAMSVAEHRLRNYRRFYKSFVLYDIGPRETLFSAVFASPATLRHAHSWGRLSLAEFESDWLERLAGRYASIETLKVAQELGMSFTLCPYVVLGAAESGDIEKLRWLLDEQHCEVPPSLSLSAARSGSTAMLAWLKQRGVPLTGSAMGKAMAFGHTDTVRFLHAQGCPWSTTLCDEAADVGDIEMIRWARERGCPWSVTNVMTFAAQQGNIELMAYVLEQEPVRLQRQLKELLYLAGTNKIEAAQWLHAQGAPWPDALSAPIIGRFKSSWNEATVAWARSEGCTSPLE